MPDSASLTLSIVSHGQAALIRPLLDDLRRLDPPGIEVIITINLPEDESSFRDLPWPGEVIRNEHPKGFGANHNAAFRQSTSPFFAVVNPDIRLPSLALSALITVLRDPTIAAVAPVVVNATGDVEDSVRQFPTIGGLVQRTIFRRRAPGYRWGTDPIDVDWAAGLFVVFRREAFAEVCGFDDRRFFMYFEDVDICCRLRKAGWRVLLQPATTVIHDAQRASHSSLKHLRWHLTSAARYFSGL